MRIMSKRALAARSDVLIRQCAGVGTSPLFSCRSFVFVASVPPSRSVLVLDTAGQLDRELASLAAYVDDIRDLLRGDARASLVEHTVARVIVTAQHLRTQVLDAAVRPDASIEIHERALRARMNIVVRALYALKQNERWLPHVALVGRFRSLRDFNLYVVDRVALIHTGWSEQRGSQPLDSANQAASAYAALDEAEIAFERLGRDVDVEQFLRLASESPCEPVATACRELAVTIGAALKPPSAEASMTRRTAGRTAS